MQFPIQSAITPVPYGPKKVGTTLKIDGGGFSNDTGLPFYQWAVLSEDGTPCGTGVCDFDQAQWTEWTDQPDEAYVMGCVAANLDLTLAP